MKAFEIWRKGGTTFLSFPGDGKVFVMDEDGNNYGSWYSVESFRVAQKRRINETPHATSIGRCRLNISPLS